MKPEQAQLHAEIERRALEGLLDAANAFYENPANKQAFEAWKNSEEAKQYGAAKAEPKKEPKAADAPVKEAPAKEEPAAKTITLQDVRAVALKFSKAGKSDVLKEIFAKFDATKLSEVPEDRYNELMEELEAANA